MLTDTNVPPSRAMQVRVYAFEGTLTPLDLLGRAPVDPMASFSRDASGEGSLRLPGSFTVIPKANRTSNAVTLWIRVVVGATTFAPETNFDRVVRFSFSRQQPLLSRVFLNASCGDQAVGCTTVSESECTADQVCAELGATCGDEGECVLPEVNTVADDRDAANDDDVPNPQRVDVVLQRRDASQDVSTDTNTDAGSDARDSNRDADVATDTQADVVPDIVPDAPIDSGFGNIAPPRMLRPLGTSNVTTSRPFFSWEYPAGTDAAVVQLCRNRAMNQGCLPAISSNRISFSIANPLSTGVWFWQLTGMRRATMGTAVSPVWWFSVRANEAMAQTTQGIVLDVNGDGLAEHAIGSSTATRDGRAQCGAAVVYGGTPVGLTAVPQWTGVGTGVGDHFGETVAAAGDIDGDGFGELLVGAPDATLVGGMPQRGTVSIYYGSAMGLGNTPRFVLGGVRAGDFFGRSIAGIGDINSDGYADIAIGAPSAGPASEGQVDVYLGNAIGVNLQLNVRLTGNGAGDAFGSAVAGAGDFNGDGFHDLAVSARLGTLGGGVHTGTVSVYYASGLGMGFSRVPAAVVDGAVVGSANFGWSLAMDGDLNGDGLADLAVGAIEVAGVGGPSAGTAMVFYGNRVSFSPMPSAIFPGRNGNQTGYAVATHGDLNGDGISDLAVSAISERVTVNGLGIITVYPGSLMGPNPAVAFRFVGGPESRFGITCSTRGDVNGDGLSDLLVGGHLRAVAPSDGGSVDVFHGRMNLGDNTATTGFSEPMTNFGSSLCVAPPRRRHRSHATPRQRRSQPRPLACLTSRANFE